MRTVLKANRASASFGAGALLAAALVVAVSPPQRQVSSLVDFLFKLVPFVLGLEAIARLELDAQWRRVAALVAVPVSFLGFFCWFVPKIFFSLDDFPRVYVIVLELTPYVILALVMALRLGGGAAELVRRLGFAMLILMQSGLEDLAFLTVNHHTDPDFASIPDRWTWASHIKVWIGHYPTKYEAYAFIALHVVAAGLVLFAPLRAVWVREKEKVG